MTFQWSESVKIGNESLEIAQWTLNSLRKIEATAIK